MDLDGGTHAAPSEEQQRAVCSTISVSFNASSEIPHELFFWLMGATDKAVPCLNFAAAFVQHTHSSAIAPPAARAAQLTRVVVPLFESIPGYTFGVSLTWQPSQPANTRTFTLEQSAYHHESSSWLWSAALPNGHWALAVAKWARGVSRFERREFTADGAIVSAQRVIRDEFARTEHYPDDPFNLDFSQRANSPVVSCPLQAAFYSGPHVDLPNIAFSYLFSNSPSAHEVGALTASRITALQALARNAHLLRYPILFADNDRKFLELVEQWGAHSRRSRHHHSEASHECEDHDDSESKSTEPHDYEDEGDSSSTPSLPLQPPLIPVAQGNKGRRKRKVPVCGDCGRTFAKQFSLRRHRQVAHRPEPAITFWCPTCPGVGFAQRTNLLRHMSTAHIKEKDHNCEHCDAAFVLSSYLRKHMRDKHPELNDVT